MSHVQETPTVVGLVASRGGRVIRAVNLGLTDVAPVAPLLARRGREAGR